MPDEAQIKKEADQITINLGVENIEVDYWQHFGRHPLHAEGIEFIYSLIDDPSCNGVLKADWAVTNPKLSIPAVIDYFKIHGNRNFRWWSEQIHEPPDLARLLLSVRMGILEKYSGMAMKIADFKYKEIRKDLKFERLINLKQIDTWVNVLVKNRRFAGHSSEAFRFMFEASNLEGGYIHILVRYRKQPIAIGSILQSVFYSTLYHVCVIPEYENKEIEEALIQELLAYADFMKRRYVLAKVPEKNQENYEALGFKKYMGFNLYGTMNENDFN
jgi:GNAT superfamily N-acetyltransferase